MNTTNDYCAVTCNSLLRGELSAGEAYGLVIDKFPLDPISEDLRRIREEHANSATLLASLIRELGGEPDTNSGAWGLLTAIAQGAANILGEGSAIDTLRKGEEIGRDGYRDALSDERLTPACKTLISEKLLPVVAGHLAKIEQLNPAS